MVLAAAGGIAQLAPLIGAFLGGGGTTGGREQILLNRFSSTNQEVITSRGDTCCVAWNRGNDPAWGPWDLFFTPAQFLLGCIDGVTGGSPFCTPESRQRSLAAQADGRILAQNPTGKVDRTTWRDSLFPIPPLGLLRLAAQLQRGF